jgi:hypothetical protein
MLKSIIIFLVIGISSLHSNETTEGMLYLSGVKGSYTETLLMPNCPYEKCDEVSGDKDKGANRTIYVQKKDLKTAAKLLSVGVKKLRDPLAAEVILKPLKKAINWKDTKPEGFLVEALKKDFGLSKKEYDEIFLLSVELLRKNNVCEGYTTKAEIYKHGAFGLKQSSALSRAEWQSAMKTCPKNSYEYMMASSAISENK